MLHKIYNHALARMCSPWAVLAHICARTLATVPPSITLPPIIGGRGSLNWFAAVVAASGLGKGASGRAAEELITAGVNIRDLGSGEGMIDAYGDPTKPEWLGSIMFLGEEVDALAALAVRSGSTTMAVIRKGFAGERNGFTYIRAGNKLLREHSYRMTAVLGVQPERAGWIIDDAGGGTPQRFMWFPGTDPRISTNPPASDGAPLNVYEQFSRLDSHQLTVPSEVAHYIRVQRVKNSRGENDALDSHSVFCREKFAQALTFLDGRHEMTLGDWELSGIGADVSTYTRALVVDALAGAADRDAEERGRRMGVAGEAAAIAKDTARAERVGRVLRLVLKHVGEAGAEGLRVRDLRHKVSGRDRPVFEAALKAGVDRGLLRQADGVWFKC
jgi:hypothetical protein